MTTIILIFLLSFVSGIIQRAIGFGSVIILMAVLPLFLPAGLCVVVSQLTGTLVCWWMLIGQWRSIDWKKVWLPTLFAASFTVIGLFFIKGVSEAVYMKALGLLLALLSIWLLCFSSRVHIRPTMRNGSITGLICGVMGAFFAVSAPPLVLYYSATTEDKDNYTACLQITLALQGLAGVAGRASMGMITREALLLCIPTIVGVVLGTIPGKGIYGRLDIRTFKLLIHSFIGILGVYIFLSH